jgi:hypothetical protein
VPLLASDAGEGALLRSQMHEFDALSYPEPLKIRQILRYSITRNVYQLRPLAFSLGLNNPPRRYFIL